MSFNEKGNDYRHFCFDHVLGKRLDRVITEKLEVCIAMRYIDSLTNIHSTAASQRYHLSRYS